MDDDRKATLRELHGYYTEEARHQRSMMWETAKWFILILGVIFGATFSAILRLYEPSNQIPTWILLVPIGIGYLISLICIALIWSFYKTNLICLSMFAKIEDDLEFDRRTTSSSFPNDQFITWQGYLLSRQEMGNSQDFVKNNLKCSARRIHTLFSFAFTAFAAGFVILTFPVLSKANMLDGCIVTLTMIIYSLLFLSACLVLREIRKIK